LYEGFKHFHALRLYLDAVGHEPAIRDAEIVEMRRAGAAVDVASDGLIGRLVEFMLSEHLAAYFFRRLAEQAVEPVLIALLHYIAADEVRHAQNASDLIAKRIATDPAVIGGVLDAAAHFRHFGAEAIGAVPLSLLAAGAGEVVAVDLNATQNHLVELKLIAASRLGGPLAVGFLGGGGAAPASRLATYARLRDALSSAAWAHWDARPGDLARGV